MPAERMGEVVDGLSEAERAGRALPGRCGVARGGVDLLGYQSRARDVEVGQLEVQGLGEVSQALGVVLEWS